MTKRLAVVSSHPIQYNAPLFRKLGRHSELTLRVFYGWKGATSVAYDHGFGRDFSWDTPLLEGYDYEFVENVSQQPGSHNFNGIDLPNLNQRIEQFAPDALLVYGWSFRAHLKALRHFKGKIPVFFRGDSTLIDPIPKFKRILRRLWLTWVYRHVDLALAVGTNNIEYFKYHGIPPGRIKLVPHAVDNEFFSSKDEERSELARRQRRDLGINEEAIVFLFAGKFESKKAPDLLLQAFNQLPHSNAHLMLVGSGPLEDKLKRLADSRVHFLGFKNQSAMPVVYRMADVLVLPSRGPHETWGLALNEAMACRRPIIASTRVGAAPDLIVPGSTGWLVRPECRESLATALTDVCNHGKLNLQSLGQTAGKFIQSFSIEVQAGSICDSLRNLDFLRLG